MTQDCGSPALHFTECILTDVACNGTEVTQALAVQAGVGDAAGVEPAAGSQAESATTNTSQGEPFCKNVISCLYYAPLPREFVSIERRVYLRLSLVTESNPSSSPTR